VHVSQRALAQLMHSEQEKRAFKQIMIKRMAKAPFIARHGGVIMLWIQSKKGQGRGTTDEQV